MSGPHEKRRRSIQSRLILLLLVILIPVLAIQAYIYYDSYQARLASEFRANLEIARTVAKAFESFVRDVLHQELAIGLAITSSKPMTPKDITRILESSKDYKAVRDFTWLNLKGDAIYSSNPAMIGINYSDRSYFREIVNGREWVVSELIISRTTGEPVFAISRGIRNGEGTLLGIAFAVIIPEKLETRLAVERGKGGGHALVDNKGMMVYRYPAINVKWEERNWLNQYPEFQEALNGKEIARTVYAPFEGKNRLVSFTPVSSIGWAASAGTREEDVTRPILGSIGKSALLSLLVSLAAFLVALAVSRIITNPINSLRSHALALGNGELPEQVKVNPVLEFQDLADTFNAMAEKVQAREMDLRQINAELEQRINERTAELRASSLYSRSLIEASLDPLVTISTDGKVTDVNYATEEVTGVTREELIGSDFSDYFTEPEKARAGYERVFSEGFVRDYPLAIRHKSGKVTEVLYNAAIYKDDKGQTRGVFAAARDVTDLRRTQQALQQTLDQLEIRIKERTAELEESTRQLEAANKELESFSYSVSHDLRAPLRAIDGYSRMLLKKHEHEFDEDSMRRFNVIRSSCHMMGQLIDDLLTFSRLHRKDMFKSKIDMEALIGEVWKELQVIIEDRKINLTVNSMPSGYGDRALIKQVYMNLLSNAAKFTKFRDPAIIEVGGHVDGNNDIYYVKDNGVGFDMAYYDKLFGVFQRLHKADEFEGTGIGLATVQRMIDRHGGRVWAAGKEDEGATFYFSLPSSHAR
jgi:PAS domain S-box-containing protein